MTERRLLGCGLLAILLLLAALFAGGILTAHHSAAGARATVRPQRHRQPGTRLPAPATPTSRPAGTRIPPPAPTAGSPSTAVRTGGISYPIQQLRRLQAAVDRGDPRGAYHLNPVAVTERDLPAYGFTPGPITILSPPPPHVAPTAHLGEDGLPETDVIVSYGGRRYWIVLNQFIRHGPAGIWSIITITPM